MISARPYRDAIKALADLGRGLGWTDDEIADACEGAGYLHWTYEDVEELKGVLLATHSE
jgi:hypothetical protein